MKRYEAYDSFLDIWVDEIPAHWETHKMKYLFHERSEKGYPDEPLLVASQNMGVVPKNVYGNRTVEAQKDLHLLKLVRVGDFVISLRSFQGGLEYAYYQGIISPAYTVLTPHEPITAGYFRYLAKSKLFIGLLTLCVTGIREGQNIDYEKLRNHLLPVPPREEQDQIVRYLDWQVSKINRLIAAKRRQIELISAAKYAFASNLVTKGLDASCAMRYSGVNWLGDIPKHWQIRKLRTILHTVSEKNRPDLPLLSVVREQGVIPRDVDNKESNHNFIPDDLSDYKVVRTHQFVINKMKAWQGSYGIAPCDGIVSPAYFVFNISFDNLEYFHHAIRSKVYVNFFAQASDGIRVGQWDLSIDKMKDIPFILPPSDEQKAIVESIKKNNAQEDTTISALEKQIAVLQELRTRLISDVVTGQVDVRGIEVPEFEYVGEAIESDENNAEVLEESEEAD